MATMRSQPFPSDVAVSRDHASALAGMVNREYCRSQEFERQRWKAERTGAHPSIVHFERVFVTRMAKLGVPMFAFEIWRSMERQKEMYAKGVSNAKPGESPHQYGCAIDLIHGVKLWGLDEKQWQLVHHVGNELATQRGIKLRWGGDWDGDGDIYDNKLFDPPHWEVANWREVKAVMDDNPQFTAVQQALDRMKGK